MNRRTFLLSAGAGGLGIAGLRYWPDQGIWNPCDTTPMPDDLLHHELVQTAWADVDPAKMWDCHVHLIGMGDSGSGIWINPDMQTLAHPIQFSQLKFYLNAACVEDSANTDQAYIERLLSLRKDYASGSRLMLLAFDYHYNEKGERLLELSSFYTPNEYAWQMASKYPQDFEWIASIHPYREDCVEALEWSAQRGARAVKWLPPAMGMDPSSPLCDRFYDAMVRLQIPLLTHAGDEHAVEGEGAQLLGNPLLLRRALDRGVRVIIAHCASQGSNPDIDQGADAKPVTNFDLFARMMDEPQYQGLLFGDISAMTQINRVGPALSTVITRKDWHPRLINGSDYPLPGVMPLFSLRQLVNEGYISVAQADVLTSIRRYNPLLFDFVLKRHLNVQGKRFTPGVFESRRHFETSRG